MSDALDKLENSVYDLGERVLSLLEHLNQILKGKTIKENVTELSTEEIFKMIKSIKDEMHKQVDIVYDDINYSNMNKSHNDLLEQSNSLSELIQYIRSINYNQQGS